MAFQLGKSIPNLASGGRITKEATFKFKGGITVERANLEDGTLGEAHPGKIVIDSSVKPGSAMDMKVQAHEADHVERMATGEAAFDDNSVTWQGKDYKRKNGKIKYNNKWREEGWDGFPWEAAAIKAEKNV
tara:strand:- start:388 stop:780 length:393 start_codon:yes stop_codon:yes gene_type:complete